MNHRDEQEQTCTLDLRSDGCPPGPEFDRLLEASSLGAPDLVRHEAMVPSSFLAELDAVLDEDYAQETKKQPAVQVREGVARETFLHLTERSPQPADWSSPDPDGASSGPPWMNVSFARETCLYSFHDTDFAYLPAAVPQVFVSFAENEELSNVQAVLMATGAANLFLAPRLAFEFGQWRAAMRLLRDGPQDDARLGAELRTIARAMAYSAAGEHRMAWSALTVLRGHHGLVVPTTVSGTIGQRDAFAKAGPPGRHHPLMGVVLTPTREPSPDGMRRAELVDRAQAGDVGAFGELYDEYSLTVYRYIYARVSSSALAEDLTSETFVRALRALDSFRWQGRDFGAWLVTIARNLITDHYKSGRVRLEVVTDEIETHDRQTEGPEVDVLAAATAEVLRGAVVTTGFQGLGYDEFEGELVRYGWAALDAWLKSGTIFARCAGIGRAVNPNERERERLIRSREDREDLVSSVVADALDKFRENAMVGGRGDGPHGGATLATYFLARLVREFPSHFRRWQRFNRLWNTGEEHIAQEREAHIDGSAGVLVQHAVMLGALRRLDPREREIVTLHYEGFSHAAIAQTTGAVSARAVEGVLSRWRKRERKILAGEEHHD